MTALKGAEPSSMRITPQKGVCAFLTVEHQLNNTDKTVKQSSEAFLKSKVWNTSTGQQMISFHRY